MAVNFTMSLFCANIRYIEALFIRLTEYNIQLQKASSRSSNCRSFEHNGVVKHLSAVLLHECMRVSREKDLAAGPGGSELTSTSVSPASRCNDTSVCMYRDVCVSRATF